MKKITKRWGRQTIAILLMVSLLIKKTAHGVIMSMQILRS